MPLKSYLPALTGLRIVAAWLVFFHHINPVAVKNTQLHGLLKQGYVGVTVFFVLSGFVIANRYFEESTLDESFLKKYYFRRWLRIYPLFWLVTTLSFIAYFLAQKTELYSWKLYFLNITFLKGFTDFYKFSGVSQTWSLTIEICFYILAPFIFYGYKKYNLLIFSLLLAYLIGFGVYFVSDANTDFMLYYTYFGRAFDFFAGFGLYIFLRKRNTNSQRFWLTTTGFFGVFVMMLLLSNHIGNELLLQNIFLPVFVAISIWGLVTEHTYFSKLLSTSTMQLLGNASYAFFLIHLGILTKLLTWINWLSYFVIINILAIMIYIWIEKPMMKK